MLLDFVVTTEVKEGKIIQHFRAEVTDQIEENEYAYPDMALELGFVSTMNSIREKIQKMIEKGRKKVGIKPDKDTEVSLEVEDE